MPGAMLPTLVSMGGLHWLGVPVTFLLVEQRSSAKVRLAEPINSPVGSRNGCARIYLVALASNST